jgi:hypothetical protein
MPTSASLGIAGKIAVAGGRAGEIGAAESTILERLGGSLWIADRDGAPADALSATLPTDGLHVRSAAAKSRPSTSWSTVSVRELPTLR